MDKQHLLINNLVHQLNVTRVIAYPGKVAPINLVPYTLHIRPSRYYKERLQNECAHVPAKSTRNYE